MQNSEYITRQREKLEDGGSGLTYKSMHLSPSDCFYVMLRRVEWLNDKIAWAQANEMKYGLYIKEREAILWMMDKIKELSEKLIMRQEGGRSNG